MKPNRLLLFGFYLCCLLARPNRGLAQGTAFTYQGHLNDAASPASGTYQFRFAIYDLPGGGAPTAGPITNTTTVSNGLFTVTLDFGTGVFTGTNRWLEIAVRTNGSESFAPLSPRQPVTPTPYALYAGNVDASGITGPIADNQLSPNVARLNANQTFTGPVSFSNGSNNFAGSFSGNGVGMTNVSANSLSLTRTNFLITGWGVNGNGQATSPPGLTNAVSVGAGQVHSIALTTDSTVVAWGFNYAGQTDVPAGLSNVTAASAGGAHNLALRKDGTCIAWGLNDFGQTILPVGLSNVIAISAGSFHNLALRRDGTVVAWGNNEFSQTNVPAGLSNVVAVSGGEYHNLALKADGTVVAWGYNGFGEAEVPSGLNNIVAVAAGGYHNLALKSNGTVVAWGGV